MDFITPLLPYLPGFLAAAVSILILFWLKEPVARLAKEQGNYRVMPGIAGILCLPLLLLDYITHHANYQPVIRGWFVTLVVVGCVWFVSKLRKPQSTLR